MKFWENRQYVTWTCWFVVCAVSEVQGWFIQVAGEGSCCIYNMHARNEKCFNFKTVWKLAMLGDLLANNTEMSIREAGYDKVKWLRLASVGELFSLNFVL